MSELSHLSSNPPAIDAEPEAAAPRLVAPLLGVALAVHLAAYIAWYDDLGQLAGTFAFPAGIIAALTLGTRGAWAIAAWALFANALLGALLPAGDGKPVGFIGTLLDAHYLVGHTALVLALTILGRQRDLKRALELQMDELARTQVALREAERMREEARLTQRLSRTERMASVGTLAAGVAHEINNPLTYVIGNLYYALEELGREQKSEATLREELHELLRDALDGAERVRRIVRDLKTFSRATDDPADQRIDVNATVQTAANLMKNEIRHRAQLDMQLEEVPFVRGSEARLVQALVNLLMNAAQAISEGSADRDRITVRTSLDGARVRIEFKDTGAGMTPELLAHIFDPFFTTKPVGVGTGLGLSVAHGIITGMGGEISVESKPGQGSTFTVLLPCDESEAPVVMPRRSVTPPRARRRVLVVDDEPKVGVSLKRMLRDWDVTVVEDGREALALLKREREFDAVLCDLMMPHLTGMDLFGEVRAMDPELARRFVFMTGGAFTVRAREFIADVPNITLEKPFEKSHVLSAVETMLRDVGAQPRA